MNNRKYHLEKIQEAIKESNFCDESNCYLKGELLNLEFKVYSFISNKDKAIKYLKSNNYEINSIKDTDTNNIIKDYNYRNIELVEIEITKKIDLSKMNDNNLCDYSEEAFLGSGLGRFDNNIKINLIDILKNIDSYNPEINKFDNGYLFITNFNTPLIEVEKFMS